MANPSSSNKLLMYSLTARRQMIKWSSSPLMFSKLWRELWILMWSRHPMLIDVKKRVKARVSSNNKGGVKARGSKQQQQIIHHHLLFCFVLFSISISIYLPLIWVVIWVIYFSYFDSIWFTKNILIMTRTLVDLVYFLIYDVIESNFSSCSM